MTPDIVDSPFGSLLENAQTHGRPLILDGAVGTELDNRGMDTSSPLWSGLAPLGYPDLLAAIQREYVAAGAQVITTSTFRTTYRAFARAGEPAHRWKEAVRAGVSIARRAAGTEALVAGSIAPLEDCFKPTLAPHGTEAEKEHMLLCRELVQAGVQVLWLETFGAMAELWAAISAARAAGLPHGVPFAVSVTTNGSGNLISGEPLKGALALAQKHGASAFSVNCIPPEHVDAALKELLPSGKLPIGVYANLGFAEKNQDWQGSANLPPEAYAQKAATWTDAGVSLIGGCCGSTPAHIEALARHFQI